jgi:hypothetical protein
MSLGIVIKIDDNDPENVEIVSVGICRTQLSQPLALNINCSPSKILILLMIICANPPRREQLHLPPLLILTRIQQCLDMELTLRFNHSEFNIWKTLFNQFREDSGAIWKCSSKQSKSARA